MPIQASGTEQSTLDQCLTPLLRERFSGRDKDDMTVRVRHIAGRCLGNVNGLAGDECGQESKTFGAGHG
jgi:hypothetical protein